MFDNKDYETSAHNKEYEKNSDFEEDRKNNNSNIWIFGVFILFVIMLLLLFPHKNPVLFKNSDYNSKPVANKQAEPDWGPYMQELQRKIKRNWHPPKGDESKRIVVRFKIDKQGNLLRAKIIKGFTGSKADAAALEAILKSTPFRPLPT